MPWCAAALTMAVAPPAPPDQGKNNEGQVTVHEDGPAGILLVSWSLRTSFPTSSSRCQARSS